MPLMINTNIASLNAQRNLQSSQNALATSLQRLSSGLRINSAKDDAAGLAISERFTSQINGLDQSVRNANDAISLAQTAEGDLVQIGNNLQRIRELAVQSANATNSTSDRQAMNQEAQQLVAEIDRVAANSNFNGTNLLDGTFQNKDFQVGANVGQTISITSIASARTSAMGMTYSASETSAAPTTTALSTGDLTINGVSVQAASSDGVSYSNASASAIAVAKAINAASGTNVTATANANTSTGAAATGTAAITAGDLTINGVSVGAVAAGSTNAGQTANVRDAINTVSAATGVSASIDGSGKIVLTATDGRNITVGTSGTATTADTGLTAGTSVGTVSLASQNNASIVIAGANPSYAGFTAGTKAATATGTAIANIDLTSVTNANSAITAVDAALTQINNSRAALGAYQNRFTSVIASLQTTSENLTASRSRIQDADFAAETASLTKNQILQQAGTAMLAQANQLPNGVMALLR